MMPPTSNPAPRRHFLLLFKNAGTAAYAALSPDQREVMTRRWNEWYDQLAAQGKVRHGEPLELEGRIVSATPNGQVIDGPFVETKEAIGGYFYLSVADLEEATAIARDCPGLAVGTTVEIRPLAARSPVLPEVHGRPSTPA
jgi:hypothetical protein